jgi:hypothetical protein
MRPIFNGTPEDTKEWLESNSVDETHWVCVGKTMALVRVSEYLTRK